MPDTRAFPLGDVLSVTTPLLLSDRGVDGLTDLLDWMTGATLEPWQLPRAAQEARPALIAQHPFLADLQPADGLSRFALRTWRMTAVMRHGADLTISPLGSWVPSRPVGEPVDPVEPTEPRTTD